MRRTFHAQLDQLADRLNTLVSVVGTTMRHATSALLDADAGLAEATLATDHEVTSQQAALDAIALDLLARQQPVATDLRTIVACLRISVDLRRMSKLAVHIAEIARAHHPECAVPADVRPTVLAMAERAQDIVTLAEHAVATRDGTAVAGLEHDDEQLDRLLEQLHRRLFDISSSIDVEHAVEVALIGRYYERYADHAVSIARRIAYVAGQRGLDEPRVVS